MTWLYYTLRKRIHENTGDTVKQLPCNLTICPQVWTVCLAPASFYTSTELSEIWNNAIKNIIRMKNTNLSK